MLSVEIRIRLAEASKNGIVRMRHTAQILNQR